MNVAELKKWLANKPDAAPVRLMIESDNCQYDAPLTDCALSRRSSLEEAYEGHCVILMYEEDR